jgi:hypothetical protein
MQFMSSVFTGVIGGVFAAAICGIFVCVWIRIIEPWYEELLYKDARIEGAWDGRWTSETGNEVTEFVDLRRKGHRVWGTIKSVTGPDAGAPEYLIQGTFKNLILTAEYESTSRQLLDRGSLTMMLVDDGEKFRGTVAYYSSKRHVTAASQLCEWRRQGL